MAKQYQNFRHLEKRGNIGPFEPEEFVALLVVGLAYYCGLILAEAVFDSRKFWLELWVKFPLLTVGALGYLKASFSSRLAWLAYKLGSFAPIFGLNHPNELAPDIPKVPYIDRL